MRRTAIAAALAHAFALAFTLAWPALARAQAAAAVAPPSADVAPRAGDATPKASDPGPRAGAEAAWSLAASELPAERDLLSERDFLTEIPRVFSASRLPQLPADSPNAITVIDRDAIRALGARDVAELFRMVPGFVVGNSSAGRAVVAYHGLSGQFTQRMQVLLDGRSLYAPYLFGGIDWNTLPIGLDDIERIEIVRGSNSAAYGANAFLGVANIITRSAAQSRGGFLGGAIGSSDVRDASVRYGAGGENFAWRLSAGQRSDSGMSGAFDDRTSRYVGVRGEWQPAANDEVSFAAGYNDNRLGLGRARSVGDPERFETTSTAFGQVRWRRSIADDNEMSFSASYTIDRGDDSFTIPVTPTEGLFIDYGRKAQRVNLEYQHWLGLTEQLRASWGGGLRNEQVVAPQLFNTADTQRAQGARAYLNAEWTPSPRWTFNGGGVVEYDSLSGTHVAPRLFANWKYSPDQTLRVGYSEAFRTPSLFEQQSDWRFVYKGETIDIRYLSRGGLRPERVKAAEVSWLAEFRDLGLSADLRAFDERVTDLIAQQLYALPPGTEFNPDSDAYDLRNLGSARIQGVEGQLRWRPTDWQTWTFGFYGAHRTASDTYLLESIPKYGASLLGSFRFAGDRSASIFYQVASPIRWIGEPAQVSGWNRLDLRFEQRFTLAGLRASVALVGQAVTGAVTEVRAGQTLPRRGWLAFSVEY